MPKIWKLIEPSVELKNVLADELKTSSLFAQLLLNRGVCDAVSAKDFLVKNLDSQLDPLLMEGMERAVERLRIAITKKERVFIATDFDVDGVTSCAILESYLKTFGLDIEHYVPHRVRDGYGLNANAVGAAERFGAKIFIALDCGITAVEEAAALKKLNIDCIIIDHHEPPSGQLPDAFAILDPKKKTCPYPFKELASVGLVFKLVAALADNPVNEYLDLVALGTVADVAPLTGENRIFVEHGLKVLNQTRRPGLRSLINAAGIKKTLSTRSIGFMLAPRLNASGRIDSAQMSLDLLLAQEPKEADVLARTLNEQNRERQKIEEGVFNQALDQIDKKINFKEDFVIILAGDDWHVGVLGIVAAKISDRFCRPTIILSFAEGVARGSARSVENFHIYEALVECSEFLKEYGGHKYAAGLSLERQYLKSFKRRMNEIARANFENNPFASVIHVDAQIPFGLINEALLDSIDRLNPFGEGNPRPVFVSRGLTVKSKPCIVGRNSLKFWVSDGELIFEAIGFGMGDYFSLVNDVDFIDLAYCLSWNDWGPQNTIQIEIKDIKVSV
ncbi:MAG: single-stranded-DNA-specific exonuclease RecJ [Candidatus Omnitrophota bacterium]